MNIYLLRHGETEENYKKTYYGNLDVSLTQKGESEGRRAFDILKGVKFSSIYSSEKKRAIDTAKIGFEDYPIIIDKRLNEINFGVFEGKTYKEIEKEFPKEHKDWMDNWKTFIPPKGESYESLYKRVENFMNELKEKSGENVLIVTHGGVIRSIYSYILGGNLDFYWKFSSKTGGVSLVKYEEDFFYIDSIINIGGKQ